MAIIILSPSFHSFPPPEAIRSSHLDCRPFSFRKASVFRNSDECTSSDLRKNGVCDSSLVNVAITLDVDYLRGSIVTVHSILQHSMCLESVFFHFLVSDTNDRSAGVLPRQLQQILHAEVLVREEVLWDFRPPEGVLLQHSSSIRQLLKLGSLPC
ncbi:Probable galacturonosyltransferase-like 7 [Linum perenne]